MKLSDYITPKTETLKMELEGALFDVSIATGKAKCINPPEIQSLTDDDRRPVFGVTTEGEE